MTLWTPGIWLPGGVLVLKGWGHRGRAEIRCDDKDQLGRVLDAFVENGRQGMTKEAIEGAIAGHVGPTTHSRIGASGAHRWMACPGSVRLSAAIEDETSEHAREGTAAHDVAARCLQQDIEAWQFIGERIEVEGGEPFTVDEEMMECVQLYLDTIYGDGEPDTVWVEHKFHLPQLHEGLFGTSDFCAVYSDEHLLRVYDYKHGRGVPVEVAENPQLMYYGIGVLFTALDDYPEVEEVELVVVQPRCDHPDGPVRRWRISVADLQTWGGTVLAPAAQAATAEDAPLNPGDHCRFCAAKSICPALKGQLETIEPPAEPATAAEHLPTEELSRLLEKGPTVRMYIKALEDEAFKRMMQGETVPGVKLVNKKADRVLKDGAEAAAVELWGEDAYERKLRSPAKFELLKGGKQFTAEWAFKPETGLTMAPEGDRRAAVKPPSAREAFSAYIAAE